MSITCPGILHVYYFQQVSNVQMIVHVATSMRHNAIIWLLSFLHLHEQADTRSREGGGGGELPFLLILLNPPPHGQLKHLLHFQNLFIFCNPHDVQHDNEFQHL